MPGQRAVSKAATNTKRVLNVKRKRRFQGFCALLLRITGPEKDNPLAIIASHPMTADRMAMLAEPGEVPEGPALLSQEEWQALKAICK